MTEEEKKKQEEAEERLETEEKTTKKLVKAERSVKHYQTFILRLLIFAGVVWFLFFFIVGITRMQNGDMYPRIDMGDMLLFYRLDKTPAAKDVIVFDKVVNGEKETFVSRVVATGGDEVEISDGGRVVVNGNTMTESSIFYDTPAYDSDIDYPITLKDDECFVLSDYRTEAMDSRYFGPVKKSEIAGTVIMTARRNHL